MTAAALASLQRRRERADQFAPPPAVENVGEAVFASVCAVTVGAVVALGLLNLGGQCLDALGR